MSLCKNFSTGHFLGEKYISGAILPTEVKYMHILDQILNYIPNLIKIQSGEVEAIDPFDMK